MRKVYARVDEVEVLRKNPRLDPKEIAELDRYCAEISGAGIDIRPRYRIAPALGHVVADVAQVGKGHERDGSFGGR